MLQKLFGLKWEGIYRKWRVEDKETEGEETDGRWEMKTAGRRKRRRSSSLVG